MLGSTFIHFLKWLDNAEKMGVGKIKFQIFGVKILKLIKILGIFDFFGLVFWMDIFWPTCYDQVSYIFLSCFTILKLLGAGKIVFLIFRGRNFKKKTPKFLGFQFFGGAFSPLLHWVKNIIFLASPQNMLVHSLILLITNVQLTRKVRLGGSVHFSVMNKPQWSLGKD